MTALPRPGRSARLAALALVLVLLLDVDWGPGGCKPEKRRGAMPPSIPGSVTP